MCMKLPGISALFAFALLLLLVLAPTSTWGDESREAKSLPVSDGVREPLEELFQKYYPEANFRNRGVNGLHFEHEVTTFEFPSTGLKGEKREAEKQRGPKEGGILCRVYSQRGPYRGQLAFVHNGGGNKDAQYLIDRKEYKQLLMPSYSQKSNIHLWVVLSYPPDVDEAFLKKFRQIMVDFAKTAE